MRSPLPSKAAGPSEPSRSAPSERGRPSSEPRTAAPFELKGNAYNLFVLKPLEPASDAFFSALKDRIEQAPSFFQSAPVVLDLDAVVGLEGFSLEELVARVRGHGLVPAAVQGGDARLREAAVRAGLGVVNAPVRVGRAAVVRKAAEDAMAASQARDVAETPIEPPAVKSEPARESLVITEPVRSGRQIYAPRGDLVVLASVSAGAELLADGHIHVYGALRGRALAGMHGDVSARIFCQSLEAELVSIAGLYRVCEELDPSVFKKPAQVFQDDEKLRIEPLS